MRRFRCKGALVAVTALLLLMDAFWSRGGIPRLQEEERVVESAVSAIQVAMAETLSANSGVPVHTPRPVATRRAPAIPATSSSMVATAASSAKTCPSATPVLALEGGFSSPLVGNALLRAEAPVMQMDNDILPPRKWSPPEGVAYIRWWVA